MLPTRVVSQRASVANVSSKDSVDVVKCSNIKVVVRLRPPNEKELCSGKVNLIKVIDDHLLTFDPKKENDWDNLLTKSHGYIMDRKIRDLHFAFDRVFDGQSSNEEVFESTTKTVIDSLLKGYNCSVFAYGATSAGKTHTMLGSPQKPGVIFLTMMELYKKLHDRKEDFQSDISVSYLEIYNETCKDLLLPAGALAVREDPEKGVCVSGLSLHKPSSAEELFGMLHVGNQNRTQHPTDANKQSSRSHAVFQVFVRQSRIATGLNTDITLAKMSLIDLAGSERATVTTNQGDRLREGANINKSLLALGNCINALAENKSKIHIPYRDSKLTRLLKDSLGGNCETIMIAAISPSVLSYEDTYNTLKYANRAKSIKASLSANKVNVDYHISQYGKIVEDLKSQIDKLNLKIEELESKPQKDNNTDQLFEILKVYEKDLFCLYKERCSFKQQLIDCQAAGKESSMKLLHKERNYKRLEYISEIAGSVPKHAKEKLDKFRASFESKQAYYLKQKIICTSSLEENMVKLTSLQKNVDDWANKTDTLIRDHLNIIYEMKQLELKNVSLKSQNRSMRKYLPLQEADSRKNEQLIVQLLQIITTQQRKLNSQHILNQSGLPDLSVDFSELPKKLINPSKISWADQNKECNVNMLSFDSDSPYRTPSKKPHILRKIVSESRLGDQTQCNTLLNTTCIKSIIPTKSDQLFTVTCDNEAGKNICRNEDISSNPTIISDYHQTSNVHIDALNIPSNTLITSNREAVENLHEKVMDATFNIPNEETLLRIIPARNKNIPVRTPLKVTTNNATILKPKKSHRRSMSDGNLFQVAKCKPNNLQKGEKFEKSVSILRQSNPKFKTSQSNQKTCKLGLPIRAVSSLQKENIRPRSVTADSRNHKKFKKYKSDSTLLVDKRVPNEHRTFRF